MPKVSVVMPVYNAEKYLASAIDSILSQTFSDLEFLIIDDGSTDGSTEILKGLTDPRVSIVHNDRNLGLVRTLNRGVRMSSGMYIARMDSDDIAEPDRFDQQVRWLDEHPECSVVSSVVAQIAPDGGSLPSWDLDLKTTDRLRILEALPTTNCIAHPTVMARKSVLLENPYSRLARHAEDYELWLRLSSRGYVIDKISKPLLRYRVHPQSITSQSNSSDWTSIKKVLRAKLAFLLSSAVNFRWNSLEWQTLLSVFRLMKSLAGRTFRKIRKHTTGAVAFRIGQLSSLLCPPSFDSRLIFFFPHYHVGGAEKVHVDLSTSLRDEHPVIFITYPSNDCSELENFKSAGHVVEFGRWLQLKHAEFFLLGRLSFALNKDKNVKSVVGSNNHFFYQLLPFLRKDLRKVDLLHTYGSGIEEYTLPFVEFLDSRIVISENVRIGLKGQYRSRGKDENLASRVCLIENRIKLPQGPFEKLAIPPLKVLYVGRGSVEKRIDLIARVAEKSAMENISAEFTFVGPDIEPWISQDRRRFCEFIGVVTDRAQLEKRYRDAHMIILLSTFEGFPMVVMEAMACGTVPVVTDVGGLNVHIKPGSTGFLVKSHSNEETIVEDAVRIIGELAKSPDRFMVISRNCSEYALKNFVQEGYELKCRSVVLGEGVSS